MQKILHVVHALRCSWNAALKNQISFLSIAARKLLMPIDIDEHIRAVFFTSLVGTRRAESRQSHARHSRGRVARPESTNTSDLLCLRNHHMSILHWTIADFIHKKGTGGSSFMLLCSCLIFCCAYLFMIRLDAHIVKTFIHPPISWNWTELFSKKGNFPFSQWRILHALVDVKTKSDEIGARSPGGIRRKSFGHLRSESSHVNVHRC